MLNDHRPLSPHLQIYKPQITSVLSILHRITGAGLALGAVLVTLWLLAALTGEQAFALVQGFRDSLIGQLMLFCWLFAFVYHLLNGIRHLKWDAGYGITMKSVYRSGWVVIFGSILLSILIWMTAGVPS
jgi:succinate dehydrogenase / fumarate reductase cytochrome b subunit